MTKTLSKELMRKTITGLAQVASDVQSEVLKSSGMELDIARAAGLVALQDALTDEAMVCVMALQGSAIGFKSDKDNQGGYPVTVVRNVLIQAAMQGARPTGNEFNIIGGNCYLTVEFFERALREYPGVTDIVCDPDRPETGQAIGSKGNYSVYVGGYASCKLNGQRVQVVRRQSGDVDQRIVVVSYQADPDQAIGKAKKRLLQTLYERIAGVTITDGGESDTPAPEPERVEEKPAEDTAHAEIEYCRLTFGAMSKTTKDLANKLRLSDGDSQTVADVVSEANGLHSVGKLTDAELSAVGKYADRVAKGDSK